MAAPSLSPQQIALISADISRKYIEHLAQRNVSREGPSEGRMRQQLIQSLALVKLYEDPTLQAKAREAMPLAMMEQDARAKCQRENDPSRYHEELLKQLLRWFKYDFFKWVNKLDCEFCGGATEAHAPGAPTADELKYGGSRIEQFRCTSCQRITRFPRYNHPGKLLETRRGRCGEWANCFTLCCRAIGLDARYVHDWTDHVWTEVFSTRQNRWLHTDCSENAFDTPLIYESGWNKQLSYVIAFSRDEVVDVIDRYTQNFNLVLTRRTLVSEAWLKTELARLTSICTVAPDRLAEVSLRHGREQMQLAEFRAGKGRQVSQAETMGRVSGSAEWRSARGEIGVSAPPEPVLIPQNWRSIQPSAADFQTNCHAKLRHPLALELTPNQNDRMGTVFTREAYSLTEGFYVEFEFELEGNVGGADGFAFVFHQSDFGSYATGKPGFELGYGGIEKSVAVEFDCYQNRDSADDPNACHISVQTRGKQPNSAHHDYSLACWLDPVGTKFTPHQRYIAHIFFDATTKRLLVGCTEKSSAIKTPVQQFTPGLSANLDLSSQATAGKGFYIGFTASTGGLCEAHVIYDVKLRLP